MPIAVRSCEWAAREILCDCLISKPTEPLITIDSVGAGIVKYHENSAEDEPLRYKRSTISVAINDLTKAKDCVRF